MIATKEKGASLVEASSGERPFSQKTSDRDDMGSDIRHGYESCTIDPDIVPFMEMTESMTKWRTGASEQDPDISADPLSRILTFWQSFLRELSGKMMSW